MPNKKNENDIDQVIDAFYKKAISDFMIGYHFRKIQESKSDHPLKPGLDQFKSHLPKIKKFWKIQLLNHQYPNESFQFKKVHDDLKVKSAEIKRWKLLFYETLNDFEIDLILKNKWIEKVERLSLLL